MEVKQPTILVVDDEESIRSLLQRLLQEAGYNVVTAANGKDALYELSLKEAKVILLDIKMPGMSGIEVLHRLAQDWPEYCVIMVTAVGDMQTAIEALKLGAYDYITKPFDQYDVKEKVLKAIEKWQRLMREERRYIELKGGIEAKTKRMQEQFIELLNSLTREHRLLHELAARQGAGGKILLSHLPPELQEPMSSVEEFKDALLRI